MPADDEFDRIIDKLRTQLGYPVQQQAGWVGEGNDPAQAAREAASARMLRSVIRPGQIGPDSLDRMMGGQGNVPLGGVFQNMKPGTELHRMPGGRADEMTPLQSASPSSFSAVQPAMMAPWLPDAEIEDDRRRRVFSE